MLSSISSFFNKYLNTKSELSTENKVDRLQLASAALLIELCKADHTIDESETNTLLNILKNKFKLPEQALLELMDLAQQEADEATSLYQFTSLINEGYERTEKIQLIKHMWEIAYADGNIDRYEEHLIRKVAELLYLSHGDFIKSKLYIKNGS